MTHTALLIEAGRIQDFIFGSNELIQNIGASELVTAATTDWLFDGEANSLLPQPFNVRRGPRGGAQRWLLDDRSLSDGLAAAVVYAGGGKALVLFAAQEVAQHVAFALSSRALQRAPGVRLMVAHRPYEPGGLSQAVGALHDELTERGRTPNRSGPLLGLSVTAACDYTGAPAVQTDSEGRDVSSEVLEKRRAWEAGDKRLTEYLGDVKRVGFGFVYNFDEMGERDQSSYLAVVHTDGNRMGDRIRTHAEQHGTDDHSYVVAQRRFSVQVQEAAHSALVSTVGLLLAPENLQIKTDPQGNVRNYIGGKVPVPRSGDEERLPFRPVVFGGDDVTFVCEGRLGLPLAAHYLAKLAERSLPDGVPLFARAGVAIVKSHFPFARAYELADELCGSAKDFIQASDPAERRLAAMDWHFAVTGLIHPLPQLRQREYTVAAGALTTRPLRIAPHDANEWRSWVVFRSIVEEFSSEQGQWGRMRNKVKALREALREGPDAVQLFLRNLGSTRLPQPAALAGAGDAPTTGWQGATCIYFDAVEALDFVIPMGGGVLP